MLLIIRLLHNDVAARRRILQAQELQQAFICFANADESLSSCMLCSIYVNALLAGQELIAVRAVMFICTSKKLVVSTQQIEPIEDLSQLHQHCVPFGAPTLDAPAFPSLYNARRNTIPGV